MNESRYGIPPLEEIHTSTQIPKVFSKTMKINVLRIYEMTGDITLQKSNPDENSGQLWGTIDIQKQIILF